MGKKKIKNNNKDEEEYRNWYKGLILLKKTPLGTFYMTTDISIFSSKESISVNHLSNASLFNNKEDWAYVSNDGVIIINIEKDEEATPREWEYILAHCMLHLGFGHFKENEDIDYYWNIACDWVIAKFLNDSHIGTPYGGFHGFPIAIKNENQVYEYIKEHPEIISDFNYSTAANKPDMISIKNPDRYTLSKIKTDFVKYFSFSLELSIKDAIQATSPGYLLEEYKKPQHESETARKWFISSYPLLGALAASFKIVNDENVMHKYNITIAAVNDQLREIYINSKVELSLDEWKFILAHEFLHAALRHNERCEDRNPLLWNIACDYVINNWLVDMKVGEMPEGLLYDEKFKNISAESLYDILYTDIRHYLNASDGKSGDIIYDNSNNSGNWSKEELDEFYRRSMQQGLEYHNNNSTNRGYLPAELIEEIHAMSRPPIRWDVELAKWFDENFTPVEKYRTYSRMSRRQSSTPDIPRPAWRMTEEQISHNIFAVLLDTSGSMDRHILAAALGTIASYSESRDIHYIRLIFCDARAYDQGIINPDDLAEAVQVKGRGGTILQPGIDFLDNDEDFPKEAPLLIITDGYCEERLNLRGRNHAYLIPYGNRLPFIPKGPVFKLK